MCRRLAQNGNAALARIVYGLGVVAASHFFVGLGAGLALLTVPIVVLGPGMDVPDRVAAWVNGPAPQVEQSAAGLPAVNRPVRGFVPGEPTPGPDAPPPTLAAATKVAAVAPLPAGVQITAAAQGGAQQPQPTPLATLPSNGIRTGVIRSGGVPVTVHRAAGIDSPGDGSLADGSPVLISSGSGLQIGSQGWRAVRGLNGVVGWVPSAQVHIDGEALAPLPTPTVATGNADLERRMISNTGGIGVALRRSPNDADRLPTGLRDGTSVAVLERSGADWTRVRADNGQEGWVPTRYLAP